VVLRDALMCCQKHEEQHPMAGVHRAEHSPKATSLARTLHIQAAPFLVVEASLML
jgi:hypothetical protein